MREILLKNGTQISINDDGETLVILPNGNKVEGCVQGDVGGPFPQIEMARAIGYGDDVAAMVADHDPLHGLLCDWLGLPTSFALGGGDPNLAAFEERAVLAVQEFMRRAGGRLPMLTTNQRRTSDGE